MQLIVEKYPETLDTHNFFYTQDKFYIPIKDPNFQKFQMESDEIKMKRKIS